MDLSSVESRKSKVESRMWSEKRLKPCQKSLQRLSDLALVIEMKRGKLGQSDIREADGGNRLHLYTRWLSRKRALCNDRRQRNTE